MESLVAWQWFARSAFEVGQFEPEEVVE